MSDQTNDQAPQDEQSRIRAAKAAVDRDYLALGRELYLAFSTGRYRENGHASFDDYAISLGVDPGRARRLRRVFKKFQKDLGVPYTTLETLGYERAIAIMPIIDRTNRDVWLMKAGSLSYTDLIAEVKRFKGEKNKRKVIKSTAGSEIQSYAPESPDELIRKIQDDRLKPSVDGKSVADDDVIYQKTIYLVGDQNRVFETALENIERRTGSTKAGYLLTCALMEFLAHEATRGNKDDGRMNYYMSVLERRYGGKLIWINDKDVAKKMTELLGRAAESDGTHEDTTAV